MAPARESVPEANGCSVTGFSKETLLAVQEITKADLAKQEICTSWGAKLSDLPGTSFPSLELGSFLVNLCLANGRGWVWTYLGYSLSLSYICQFTTLSVLTARVIPVRQQQPETYQKYLEVTSAYILCVGLNNNQVMRERAMKIVDEALQLSRMGEAPLTEPGTSISYFILFLVNRLTDAIAEDWNAPPMWNEKQKMPGSVMHGDISHGVADLDEDAEDKQLEERDQMRKSNSLLALELVTKLVQNKRTSTLLRLARKSLPDQWSMFVRTLRTLELLTRNKMSSAPKEAPEALANLANAIQRGLNREWQVTQLPVIQALLDSASRNGFFRNAWGAGCTNPWLPLDIYMESAMEKQRLHIRSPSAYIADMLRTLQAIQGATWHEVFLGAWTAALRLIQREREWVEGPKAHIESRLCMLLTHVPMALVILVEEEEKALSGNSRDSLSVSSANGEDKEKQFQGVRRGAVALSVQVLGQFDALLAPPKIAISIANQAAASMASAIANLNASQGMSSDPSAMAKVTGLKTVALLVKEHCRSELLPASSRYAAIQFPYLRLCHSLTLKLAAVGSLRHLVVEACISRGLLDASAYFWFSKTQTGGNMSTPSAPQTSPWAAFMDGAPLSTQLQAALTASPASSLAELEKVYQTAMCGAEEERAGAASVLCGASLTRGWNVQEHAIRLAVRLLSPPLCSESASQGSHLIAYGPMLYATLDSMTSEDILNILALHGMFPELVASLLPICEVFGSLPPITSRKPAPGEDFYKIFSLAFLLLVRLWKFHRPPLEHCLLGSGPGLGADLSLEYLLQIRSMQNNSSQGDRSMKDPLSDPMQAKRPSPLSPAYAHTMSSVRSPLPSTPTAAPPPVVLDAFPKLKAWYTQHQACIASTLSCLVRGNPVHQVADRLLHLMFKKFSTKSTSSNSSGSSGGQGGDEKPAVLTAWDVLAAVPVVVDQVLTACSHGRLSPRDLTTGLRDMVDYLPATIASFISCCGAEVYRGLYKPASMNGTEWPSPSANLLAVEAQIQGILASCGVVIPSLVTGAVGGNAPASLALPLAALISLTITFKLDKQSEMVLGVAGPALETASSGGPWPSMAIVAALWSQKTPRWQDYIVVHAARAIFKQNNHAMSQLLRSCFAVTLSMTSSPASKIQGHGGVGPLLGHGYRKANSHQISSLGPGVLFLKAYPTLHDIMFISDEIIALVAEATNELSAQVVGQKDLEAPTAQSAKLNCVHPSLSTTIARASQASTLGASLLTVAGGATLVRKLYVESLPTWLLSGVNSIGGVKSESKGTVLEGYAMARFALLSGALAWGTLSGSAPSTSPFSINLGIPFEMRRQHVLGCHLELLANAMDGKIPIRCKQPTWKAYVIGFVALIVTCTPSWIMDVKFDTLSKLATGLRWWNQQDLAIALLERGNPVAVGMAAELALLV